MTTARKRWWQAAAIAAAGGAVVTGGWFGLVRAKGEAAKTGDLPAEATTWTRSAAPPAPVVTEIARAPEPEPAPPTGPVTQAGATLPPIPLPGGGGAPVVPAIPVSPPVPVPPIPFPSAPAVLEPVSGPRAPDTALLAVPPVPALPPAQLPDLPVPPKTPEVKPVVPLPGGTLPMAPAAPAIPANPVVPGGETVVPPLPMSTSEPPRATLPQPPIAPASPVGVPPIPPAPAGLALPQPTLIAPSPPPAKAADPAHPVLPANPNSDLKPINPGNTLNPTVAPAVPITPGATGREAPAFPVDRSKVPDPTFAPTDKYVFPVPAAPGPIQPAPHLRDDTMYKLTTTAAFAVLGGALMAADRVAAAVPVIPPSAIIPPSGVIPKPSVPAKAYEKTDTEKLKTDLAAANKKIEDLEKQVKRLTELLTGKKDELGILINPKEPGTIEDVKALKDKIAAMEKELTGLKTQTALRPSIAPEAKPKGTVKVVNEYPVEISMVINDKSYRIAPGTKLDVEVPAGDFTYQLLQSGAAATRSVIKDKETVTLRIK